MYGQFVKPMYTKCYFLLKIPGNMAGLVVTVTMLHSRLRGSGLSPGGGGCTCIVLPRACYTHTASLCQVCK